MHQDLETMSLLILLSIKNRLQCIPSRGQEDINSAVVAPTTPAQEHTAVQELTVESRMLLHSQWEDEKDRS